MCCGSKQALDRCCVVVSVLDREACIPTICWPCVEVGKVV
jgi:hypothetical protein